MPQDDLDPLRHIEGFPLGEDADLHALSNPPYYTAYPNPHIAEFIAQHGTAYDEATDDYHREPYVSDVSEGKNDLIYLAHGYHTKVPYRAIVPFIEHYTKSGDVVFDGFCGSGMTGIASQFVDRYAILCDLSPAATFIAHNYNSIVVTSRYWEAAEQILANLQSECAWMYQTKHSDGRKGTIKYTIWSDVYQCPYCKTEFVFYDAAVDPITEKVLENFSCPSCDAVLQKKALSRVFENFYDSVSGKNMSLVKQAPVRIKYVIGKKSYSKRPDDNDLKLFSEIQGKTIPYSFPVNRMPDGDEGRRNDRIGLTHVHLFYFHRDLWVLSKLFDLISTISEVEIRNALKFAITSMLIYNSKLVRFRESNKSGPLSGTLYVSSLIMPLDAYTIVGNRFKRVLDLKSQLAKFVNEEKVCITTQSSTKLSQIPTDVVDYIFTDPPFGANLMYSDLSFLWEAWLGVITNSKKEAIIARSHSKNLNTYRDLMTACFSEMYRVLKPGRWITVVFHNSKASVWNAIQDALMRAGFVVAQVTVLDKQQGSFKQVTSAGAVKNDLVINAYKPRAGFTQQLISQAGRGLEVDFVREHLHQLPVAVNVERSKEMLYSKYLAYYVQHGYQVAYNGEQFYRALAQWGLEERDGYWFADEAQAQEYEQRKVKNFGKKGISPQAVLFVSDERSARQWVWNFLDEPKTYDEIYTAFVKALQTKQDEIPELKDLLEESFVRTNGHWKRPDQLTQAELEQKRLERLLRQFNEYLVAAKAGQKLKEVRKEAVVAGFTECYRTGKFQDILTVGNKLHKRLLEESPELFDFVDIAEAKIE